jgi:endonuclease
MRDMVDSLALKPGQPIARQQVVNWFSENYPKLKTGTISAHLTRMSTNAQSRTHYSAIAGEDDLFYQIDRSRYRLYDPSNDPEPIRKRDERRAVEIDTEDDDEPANEGSAQFAYEADLKNYLVKNLSAIERGLVLYEDDGIKGIEYPAGGRFIDILAIDSDNNYVVIELKVSRGYDRVVGQLMRYMAWIEKNQADSGQDVRGIIVAREISKDLVMACSLVPKVSMYEYELSLDVTKVQ